jgi:CRISPR/Cas system CMR subunit Cmr4 (Cas7 group RAMP superfamily)
MPYSASDSYHGKKNEKKKDSNHGKKDSEKKKKTTEEEEEKEEEMEEGVVQYEGLSQRLRPVVSSLRCHAAQPTRCLVLNWTETAVRKKKTVREKAVRTKKAEGGKRLLLVRVCVCVSLTCACLFMPVTNAQRFFFFLTCLRLSFVCSFIHF